jgi:hypothetical protein
MKRDVTLGILLLVISQFFILGVAHITHYPNFWEMFSILVLVDLFSYFFNWGLSLIAGKDDTPES